MVAFARASAVALAACFISPRVTRGHAPCGQRTRVPAPAAARAICG
jgi:hypothetical protein